MKELLDSLKNLQKNVAQCKKRTFERPQANNVEEASDFEPDPDLDDEPATDIDTVSFIEVNLIDCPEHQESWYLDSGATQHVTGNSSLLVDLLYCSIHRIKTAGGQVHPVSSQGHALLRFPNGVVQAIPDILFVLNITKNLLSVGVLTDHGYEFEFS